MTAPEIRAKREKLEAEILELREKIEILVLKRKHLEKYCKHPNGHRYSCMGDPGYRCPDCGYDS